MFLCECAVLLNCRTTDTMLKLNFNLHLYSLYLFLNIKTFLWCQNRYPFEDNPINNDKTFTSQRI